MPAPSGRTVEIRLGGPCGLSCPVCDCRERPTLEREVSSLAQGAARVTLRGGTLDEARVADVAQRARAAGASEVVLRTPALHLRAPSDALRLRAVAVDAVQVPLFSQSADIHDRVARRSGALVASLVGLRAAAAAGLGVEVEVPLLPPRLQDLDALIALALRSVHGLRRVRFYVPRGDVPAALDLPPWPEVAPGLARALARCRERGVVATLTPRDGVPFCVLGNHPDALGAFRFDPRAPPRSIDGCVHPPVCHGCAVRDHCPGVTERYQRSHDASGLAPFAQRPRALYEQRTSPAQSWTEARRAAARRSAWLVLRPTVNCNQDCVFCSVNETARNHWTDPRAMHQAIARAARRGVHRVCFTGGEPTLSPHLAGFIESARRCGVPEVDLCTNGVLLDAPGRAARLRSAGLTHAFVSLHAHDEAISQAQTLKAGDWARTVRATEALLDLGVEVTLNHVINATNLRYLTRFAEFARERFGGRAAISFTLVTPQYKALENFTLVPRISDVVPHLMRAAWRCLSIGQPFYVGARQGIPPCFLGPFRGWSDLLGILPEAVAEDADEKVRGPQCDRCRYTARCTGLWRPYAERYGLGELKPVEGPPFTDDELPPPRPSLSQRLLPRGFDDVPDALRDRPLEALGAPTEAPPVARVSLPVLRGTRPLRVALLGSAGRARQIARGLRAVPGLVLDAVVSPHAPDGDPRDFDAPAWRDAAEALDALRPDVVVVAAATRAHRSLVALAVERGVPALVEKPVGESVADTLALRDAAALAEVPVVPAHNVLFSPGLEGFFVAPASRVDYLRRVSPSAPDAPLSWDRQALGELLYHALVLAGRAAGGGDGEVLEARWRGDDRPRWLHLSVRYPRAPAEVVLDYEGADDELTVTRWCGGAEPERWSRRDGHYTVGPPSHPSPVARDGGELERMLAHFREVVLKRATPWTTLDEAAAVKRAVTAALDALAARGAVFRRPEAPRHVAQRDLARQVF